MAKKNAFDALATTATPASKKASHPMADTTDEVKQAVEDVISIKARMDTLKQELSDAETTIIDHVRPQQDGLARKGEFTKSMTVPGFDGNVTYVTSDKFSALTDQVVIDHVKDLLKKKFDEFFTKSRTIAIKKEVVEDDTAINKLVAAFTKAGLTIGDYFTVTDATVAVKGMDEKQYELSDEDLKEFRGLVKQSKPALK